MNIGFIEDTPLHGGTQIWVTEALRAFLARGEEVTLLAPEGSWMVRQCAGSGARIFTYDWDEVVQERDEHIQIWTEALRQCDVSVCTVHPPREDFHCSVFAARSIAAAGLQTHLIPKTGTIVPEYERRFYRPEKAINTSVIAIADFTRQYLIETYGIPEFSTTLIYQGVDTKRFRSTADGKKEARKRYLLPDNATPVLASVGSFEHRKGHPVLFEAVKRLASGPLPDIHLMLVGDGPDEHLLRNLAEELGLANHVSLFPFTSEPNYVFERADMTVLPSLYKEGLPNVLQESMAMNVPVISSRIGGVPEVVFDGQTGYMVDPGNSDQLAEAILNLWTDQEAYRKICIRARELILERFNKENQFEQFLEYFRNITGEHHDN
ncbi:MAG: glycosyltransferase family 4 protein [Gammaproteobacteria bacterium]|nr:glycosyltransferase family 4 protein [Gammaproteobacteria bacterium]